MVHRYRATLNEEFKKNPTRYSTLLWEADLHAYHRERTPPPGNVPVELNGT